jgi:ferric-dicitrate binding protein FerR (iron transport regulator)
VNKNELLELIDKYLSGNATRDETEILKRYYNSLQQNKEWNEAELGSKSDMEEKIFARMQDKMKLLQSDKTSGKVLLVQNQLGIIHFPRPRKVSLFAKIAIAASIIGIIAFSSNFIINNNKIKQIVTAQGPQFKNDVAPGGDKAILTLADGSTIVLDNAGDGTLVQQGSTKVIKLGSRLSYDNDGNTSNEVTYNTISTPRGGQYQVELPDGSLVWLNAASTLRFPTSFVGKERRVQINGEVYMEIAKNKTMPFIVNVNNAEVQVLGTHFNVMAYNEESALQTTLLEGSIRFVSDGKASLLKPGQQMQLSKSGQARVINDVDLGQVVAWKNGLFVFDDNNIETIMRQLARWYDVEIQYQSRDMQQIFVGEVPRNSKLSDVLKVLELAGNIKFEIEGKKIIVK